MIIRKAKLKDLSNILVELKKFASFYGVKKSFFPSEEVAEKIVINYIEEHVFFVAEEGERFLGFIAGISVPHPFNPSLWVLNESFWWVKEDERKTGAGFKLLDEFVEFGKEYFDYIYLTLESDSPVDEKHFLNRGFVYKEKNFFMEVS